MAETYTVEAKLIADINDYSSKLSQAAKQMSGFSNDTEKSNKKAGASFGAIVKGSFVGGAALGVVSAALGVVKNSVGSAVRRFDTLNAYPKIMKQMGFSTQDTNKSIDVLKKGIDGLPTSLQDITKSSQSFAILTGSASSGAKTAIALNDAFIASGASAADASRGVEQYSQMLASGKVDMVGWRSLQETMPASLKKVATAFGFTGKAATKDLYGALQSGQITMDELNKKFIELDGGANGFANTARTASGGIGTSFTNMKNAVTNGLADMLKTIDSSLKANGMGGFAKIFDQAKVAIKASFAAINGAIVAAMPTIVGVIKGIVSAIQSAISFVQSNSDWLMPLTIGIASFVGSFKAITGAMSAFSKLKEIGTGLVTTFNALKAAMAANPYVIVAAAVIALVAALVYFFTQTKTGQKVWAAFTDFLKSAWAGMVEFFTGIWNGITAGVTAAASFISSAWTAVVGTIQAIWNGIVSFFATVWSGITAGASIAWQAILTFAEPIVTVLTALWTNFVTTITGIWNGIVTVAAGIWELVKAAVLGPILILIDLLTGNWSQMAADAQMIWNSIVSAVGQIVSGFVQIISSYISGLANFLSTIWNAISSVVSSVWNGISSFISSVWSGIVRAVSNAVNSVKNAIVNTWNALPGIASNIWNGLKSAVSNILSGLIGAVASLGSSIVSSLRGAWSGLTGMVSGIWNGVKSAIDAAMHIDLGAAGRAIMNSFLDGLTAAWGAVKKFVGGIADWIRDHKGPISYDRKLLIPAGGAIMGGLNEGLSKGFTGVMSNVSSMAGNIANAVSGSADYRINAVSSGLNIGTDGTLSVDMTRQQQPATINLSMGGSTYRGFVDDISTQQGQTATLNRASIV
nr:hypothetical protein LBZUJACN_LBZUJACN_CDS_0003 [Caudoviricetes sp.]CAI9750950.1 hypothetical protein MIHLRAQX_MIHLRAQX_CDS_0003 [Caudoviricetes sp.]